MLTVDALCQNPVCQRPIRCLSGSPMLCALCSNLLLLGQLHVPGPQPVVRRHLVDAPLGTSSGFPKRGIKRLFTHGLGEHLDE
jgi:hypothetical protein